MDKVVVYLCPTYYIVLMFFRLEVVYLSILLLKQYKFKSNVHSYVLQIFRKSFYVLFLFAHLLPVQVNLTFTIPPNPKPNIQNLFSRLLTLFVFSSQSY